MKRIRIMFGALALSTSAVFAQNTAVMWSAFDQGFAAPTSSRTMVRSVAGQSIIGLAQSSNTRHEAGFLADTLLRGTPPFLQSCTFQRWFNGLGPGGTEQGTSVLQTSDSGYVISGGGNARMYIVKTNSCGTQLWSHMYPTPSYDWCNASDATSDGGFIFAGFRSVPNTQITDVFYVRTNAQGDTLWRKKIGEGSNSQATGVQQTPDGGFILVGFKPRPAHGDNDFYLLKTNAAGDTLWTKMFNSAADIGTSVERTTDGGYIVTGQSQAPFIIYIVLLKTDSLGTQRWLRTIGPSNNEARATAVRQTLDGGYVIAGRSGPIISNNYSAYLVKTDTGGTIVWEKRFRDALSWTAYDVRQTRDGGYILTGDIYNPTTQVSDLFLLKTNINGDSLWSMTFGGPNNDRGLAVRQTFDGGYVIAGFGGPSTSDMYLIKTDAVGTVTAVYETPSQRIPERFELLQNYPNPFNPTTRIKFTLSSQERDGVRSYVTLKVYDVLGREVATLVNEVKQPGSYEVTWDATGFASGVYFYRLSVVPLARRDLVPTDSRDGQAGKFVQTRKLVLLR